jgi:hypothetical protein
MSKDGRFAIGGLIAFSFWVFVVLPLYYGSQDDKCSTKNVDNYGFWEKTRCDPIAFLTAWLVGFTGVLAFSTGALWFVTWRSGVRQVEDSRIIERAYVKMSHQPPGAIFAEGNRINSSVEVRNFGQTPARVTDVIINTMVLAPGSPLPDDAKLMRELLMLSLSLMIVSFIKAVFQLEKWTFKA